MNDMKCKNGKALKKKAQEKNICKETANQY